MNELLQKLSMSGYGLYVWGSFLCVFFALAALLLRLHLRFKKVLKNHQARNKDDPSA